MENENANHSMQHHSFTRDATRSTAPRGGDIGKRRGEHFVRLLPRRDFVRALRVYRVNGPRSDATQNREGLGISAELIPSFQCGGPLSALAGIRRRLLWTTNG